MKDRYRAFAKITVAVLAVAVVLPFAVGAATITSGNLTLGDPRPGNTTTYTFSGSGFTTGTSIRCIQLRFANNADGTGGAPTGLTTTGATLSSNTIATGTWTVGNAAGVVRATNTTGATPAASGTIVWGGIVNGSSAAATYYGLFDTYTNTDCSTGPVDSTVVAFVYKDGALVSLTVEPTLSFTIAAVNSGQSVNSATTTLTTTPTAINFSNDVTAAAKGVSAHNLTVATNAANGFTVNLRQTGGLTNGTYTIPSLAGATNAAPIAFSAAGIEAWGYTTEDSSLAGTTANRFTSPANRWAGMSTTNELVMDSGSSGTQTTRVGHQIGISNTTPAGSYNTTLVYTAAGVY